jgi:tRNA dimethylallyltransferase
MRLKSKGAAKALFWSDFFAIKNVAVSSCRGTDCQCITPGLGPGRVERKIRSPIMHTGSHRIKIVVICGPTGVGKTAVAVAVGQALGAEVVGADAMQVYRGMDIGTAKPTAVEKTAVRHHLIDVVDPDQPFDAACYARLARQVICELHGRGIGALVVGGTGLYIRALTEGLFDVAASNEVLRRELARQAQRHGAAAMHARLAQVDPDTAARLHPNDAFRVVRALEVYHVTGRPLSAHHRDHGFADRPFDVLKIGLTMDRPALYRRLDQRVQAMIAAGLLDEVKGLLDAGYKPQLKSMQSIGYRHMAAFVQGTLPWDDAVAAFKRDTRRYAKRQMTWFRTDTQVCWYDPMQADAVIQRVATFGLMDKRPSG